MDLLLDSGASLGAQAALPTVTAIIPTYNRRAYIVRAIESVLDQSRPPRELIVVDDGSTDGTSKMLKTLFGDRIKLIRQPNTGVSGARRAGLEAATGDWIAFLDSDDEWAPGRMEKLLRAANLAPADVPWVFGNTLIVSDGDLKRDLFEDLGFALPSGLTVFDNTLATQYPFQFSLLPSSLVKREAFMKTGAFTEGLRSSEDFLASFRMAIHHRFAAIGEIVTVVYRTSDLKASSLDQQERQGADYYMARILAFEEAATHGSAFWRKLHENAVRGCCIARTQEGRPARLLALQQFRYRISLKALAFTAVALLGPRGVQTWRFLSRSVRRPPAVTKYQLER